MGLLQLFVLGGYNYYPTILESIGLTKAYDTYSVEVNLDGPILDKVKRIAALSAKKYNVRIDNFSYKNLEKDLSDVHNVLTKATNEFIYQDAPSMDLIRKTLKSLKFFIEPKLVKIARDENGEAIGFSLTLIDVNEIIKKTNGKINPIKFLLQKKKAKRCRGMLQYVIPKYQNKGTIAQLFYETQKTMRELKIEHFEAGTIMENNSSSWQPFVNLGGEISKIFRIYGKEI